MTDPRRQAVVKIIYHAMTHGPIYSAGAVADQVFAALAAVEPGDAERVREDAAKWHENQIVDRRDLAMCQDRIRIAILDENRKHAEAAKAIRSIPISPREPGAGSNAQRYRHKKRGTTYTLVGRAEIQAPRDAPLTDYEVVQIYRSEADGDIYVRRISEFNDGRFEKIESVPPAIPARGEADAGDEPTLLSMAKDIRDRLTPAAPSPSKTDDEAVASAANARCFHLRDLNKDCQCEVPSQCEAHEFSQDLSAMRAAITAYHVARFGGDPGEKIRLQNARIRQLEALLDAKKSPKVEGEFPHHVVKAAQIAFDAHQRSAPADSTFWPMRAALSAARATLQPKGSDGE